MLSSLLKEARRSVLARCGSQLLPRARSLSSAQAPASELALISEVERMRIAHDLHALQRKALPTGQPGIRHAAVLVPLCHVAGVPSVLFTVRPKGSFEAHRGQAFCMSGEVGFPGMCTRGIAPQAAAQQAGAEALRTLPLAIRVLGTHHDCPDMFSATIVTPVLGYLGEIYPAQLQPHPAHASEAFALPVEELLSERSLAVELDEVMGPVPAFNSGDLGRRISGPAAAVLHGALRVVVGHSQEHRAALYAPFLRFQQQHGAPPR